MRANPLVFLSILVFLYYGRTISLNHKSSSEESTSIGGTFKFLKVPFTKMFTFTNGNAQNTGIIPGLPAKADFILGSVITRSDSDDHINFLLGDSSQIPDWLNNPFYKWTWWDDNGITPALDFGAKLIAITNPGEKDNFKSFYGIWRFVMIPTRNDKSFDIIPGGYSNQVDRIGFNLIAYV